MSYQVRVNGKVAASYATQEEALAHVRAVVAENPDQEPEIVDSDTGRSVEPASTQRWRDDLSGKVGY